MKAETGLFYSFPVDLLEEKFVDSDGVCVTGHEINNWIISSKLFVPGVEVDELEIIDVKTYFEDQLRRLTDQGLDARKARDRAIEMTRYKYRLPLKKDVEFILRSHAETCIKVTVVESAGLDPVPIYAVFGI